MPDLLESLDPGVSVRKCDRARLDKTAGFTDSLLRYRIFQPYGKCLLRSLVLFRFLRSQGWPVDIYFGVRKTNEGHADITGHSWLVLDGKPFLEDDSQQNVFVTTWFYPS
ncbi:MAG: lasso peptide biosynthesis B2 protein [Thermoleophilia bacterium]